MKQKLKKHRKKIVVIAVILLLAIAVVVIIGKVKNGQTKKGKQEIQKENTVSLEKMDLTKSISATGTIESKEFREVSANVNGVTINKVNVSVGDEVKKGKSLITFDETDLQESLDKCAVTAPMDGIVTSISVQEGDTYSGGTILQIEDVSGYTISTSVDEYDISNVKVGQKVIVLTEATDEDELEGEVTFVAPSTESSSGSSSSQSGESGAMTSSSSSSSGYEVQIALKNADERLKLGLTARCSIVEEEAADVFAVPYDAISQNTNGESVINVSEGENGSISKKQIVVTKGMESDYYVEVQSDELTEGMKVIIPTDSTSDSTSEESGNDSLGGLLGGGGGMQGGSGGGPGGAPGGGGRP